MIMWQGYHEEGKYIIIIDCIYNSDSNTYELTVVKNGKNNSKTLSELIKAQEKPKDGYMNIKDLEKTIKIANRLLKQMDKVFMSVEIEDFNYVR